jgi:hypothetical protein
MKDYESIQAASSLHKSSGLEINLPGEKDARLHRSLWFVYLENNCETITI